MTQKSTIQKFVFIHLKCAQFIHNQINEWKENKVNECLFDQISQ